MITEKYKSLVPNFDGIIVEKIKVPYGNGTFKKYRFDSPVLSGYEVTVAADTTISLDHDKTNHDSGNRLTTMICRFPRAILAEVNTHRVFSRNSASSRARSIKMTIQDVMVQPYIPLFTKNQKGMSGVFLDSNDYWEAVNIWLKARDKAVWSEIELLLGESYTNIESNNYQDFINYYYDNFYDKKDEEVLSVHKQNANRLIEPYMWHEAIISSTFWNNFIELRTDLNAAQPEIVALSKLIEKALEDSKPEKSWIHLPFVPDNDKPQNVDNVENFDSIRDILMLSATEAAQVSYKDKSKVEKSTATTTLGERLLKMKHMSPFEHIAFSREAYSELYSKQQEIIDVEDLTHCLPNIDSTKSNFSEEWVQLRQIFQQQEQNIEDFI